MKEVTTNKDLTLYADFPRNLRIKRARSGMVGEGHWRRAEYPGSLEGN